MLGRQSIYWWHGLLVGVIACEAPKLTGTIGFTMPVVYTLLIIFPEA